ncbi:hypothetical protein [uncultured Amphritea sp.]|uniref:hypothetical protein n=1 Tax=uncultured Amphritea sp. TaxID=981605 RepID=UPI002617ED50|nr:hypothetical protein [uncultured Amphritea sp.]
MTMLKLLIPAFLAITISPVAVSSPVSMTVHFLPKSVLDDLALSEMDWEIKAGGDPADSDVYTATGVMTESDNPVSVTPTVVLNIASGSLQKQIPALMKELGFAGGQWTLADYNVTNDIQIGAADSLGVLQGILDYTELDGQVKVYKNQTISFDPN